MYWQQLHQNCGWNHQHSRSESRALREDASHITMVVHVAEAPLRDRSTSWSEFLPLLMTNTKIVGGTGGLINLWRHPRQTQILPAINASVKGELLVGLVVQGISGGGTKGRELH